MAVVDFAGIREALEGTGVSPEFPPGENGKAIDVIEAILAALGDTPSDDLLTNVCRRLVDANYNEVASWLSDYITTGTTWLDCNHNGENLVVEVPKWVSNYLGGDGLLPEGHSTAGFIVCPDGSTQDLDSVLEGAYWPWQVPEDHLRRAVWKAS